MDALVSSAVVLLYTGGAFAALVSITLGVVRPCATAAVLGAVALGATVLLALLRATYRARALSALTGLFAAASVMSIVVWMAANGLSCGPGPVMTAPYASIMSFIAFSLLLLGAVFLLLETPVPAVGLLSESDILD